MKELILAKEKLPNFVKELMQTYKVFAPIKKTGFFIFQELTDPAEFTFDYSNTKVPPKEIFFPRAEVLFTYTNTENGIEIFEPPDPEPQAIIGIRPCDCQSFILLQKFFNFGKFNDPYFQKRRDNTLIIGLSCTDPASTCFCLSTGGSPFGEEGMDIVLTDLEDKYFIKSLNTRGDKILEAIPWLQSPTEHDLFEVTERTKHALSAFRNEITIDSIKEKLDKLFDEESFWSDSSLKCVGCGSCSYLCPTCHCFDVVDEKTAVGGKRVRLWDTCQFPLFTLHGSGHNPRPTGSARMRQRVMHKFNYYPKVLQEIGCVGCGRCILACPVNQDIRAVLKSIEET